jgi:hypothetical protein
LLEEAEKTRPEAARTSTRGDDDDDPSAARRAASAGLMAGVAPGLALLLVLFLLLPVLADATRRLELLACAMRVFACIWRVDLLRFACRCACTAAS